MFTSLLAVPIAISFFNPFPFPSINPFPFPTNTPAPSAAPSQSPSSSPTPAPSISTAVEIEDIDPGSANFMQEFTITGFNFGNTPGSVSFRYYNQGFPSGGAPIVSWNQNEIRAKVPAVKKGSYRIQVITSENEQSSSSNKKSAEERFTVKNGQPIINSTSVRLLNGEYELVFGGSEFGSRRGSIDIYAGDNLAGNGIIKYWSSSRVRFELPELPHQEYGFRLTSSDGRQSSFKFFTLGN